MIRLPLAVLVLTAGLAFGQKDGAVPKDPILCLEPGGPTAAVTCLAFAKDRTGDVLYSAGIDKVIRVWRPAPAGGFTLRPEDGLRIPIGPGLAGSINRMAVTPDGEFLAVTGNGVIPGMAGFGKGGEQVIGQGLLSKEQRRDLYAVYVFSPARRTVTVLRGPEELVQNLAFAVADGKAVLVAQGPRFGPAEEKVMTGRGYAWDVELADGRPRGKLRADWEEPNLPFHEARPGLAVRLTATGTLLAAAAWGDGTFRVREVDPTGQTRRSAPESSTGRAQFTLPVAAIPGGWLTGGGLAGKGYVQAWSEDRPPTAKWSVDLPPPESVPYLLPTDFGLIAGGEKLDHVAAIVRYPEKRYALALLSFAEVKVTALIRDALFPEQRVSPPAFACSPDGRWVAVAGRGDKEIRVLAAADLVKGAVPGDTLKSAGTDFAAAAFVRGPKGIGRGLLLSTRPKAAGQAPVPDKTDLVLDFNTRKLEPAGDAGWTAYEPAAAGWTATLTGKTVVTWTGPGRAAREVQLPLPEGHEVTDVAICPPAAGGVAVLAVASWKASTQEPLLQLFELPGGARVRLLAGHTRAIRSLAASADGQFLASVADDQTTCVWDLRDLNATVGKLADVGGVRFVERDKRLVVETVEDQQKMFEPGDVLAAVTVMAGALPKEVPLTSAADYKAAVWPRAPGDKLTFAVVRKNERRTVQVTLEQMADERKPFLTVFANAPERQWVAWTPAGTFDAAGRDAERYIGWQFNPPRLDGPVQFAFVEQYRDKLRDGGLLKTLAGVPDRISRLPRPDLVVSHQGRPILDIADGGAPLLVAEAKLKLNVAVPNLSIPDGQLAALIWSVGGPPNDLLGEAGPDRVADITLPGRGDHRITFRARTREADPQDVTYDVLVRFHPPAPTLKLIRPQPGRVTVHEPEAVVEFDAVPAEGQKADIQVLQNGRPVKIEAGAKKVGITLAEGENVLSVVASNGGVPDDFRERETARATAVLVYQPPAAPDVVLTDLLPKGATGPVKLVPGQPTVIATSEVELGGRITAPEPLTSLTVNGAPVPGFVADKVKETDLKVKVELKPGTNTITVVSATKNARPTTARLTVSYRPPLPVVEIQTPAQNDEIDGTATDRVEFRAVATPSPNVPADHARRFELLIRVMHQGKPVPQGTETEVVIPGAEKPMTVRRPLTLRPGPNLIAVRVRSTVDGTTETLGERRVTVLRKPAIETAAHSPPNRQRKTDLTLTVRSADKVTEVLVNGRTRPFNTEPRAAGGYSVKVVDVQLEPGSNRLAVVVANADGRSAETAMTVAAADPARDDAPPGPGRSPRSPGHSGRAGNAHPVRGQLARAGRRGSPRRAGRRDPGLETRPGRGRGAGRRAGDRGGVPGRPTRDRGERLAPRRPHGGRCRGRAAVPGHVPTKAGHPDHRPARPAGAGSGFHRPGDGPLGEPRGRGPGPGDEDGGPRERLPTAGAGGGGSGREWVHLPPPGAAAAGGQPGYRGVDGDAHRSSQSDGVHRLLCQAAGRPADTSPVGCGRRSGVRGEGGVPGDPGPERLARPGGRRRVPESGVLQGDRPPVAAPGRPLCRRRARGAEPGERPAQDDPVPVRPARRDARVLDRPGARREGGAVPADERGVRPEGVGPAAVGHPTQRPRRRRRPGREGRGRGPGGAARHRRRRPGGGGR